MHDDLGHFDFTFPDISVSEKETRPSLSRLLYKGGASVRASKVAQVIQDGLLGEVLPERFELVRHIYDFINGRLAGGGRHTTARQQIENITRFFGWADESGIAMSLTEVEQAYCNWAEHLWHRAMVKKDIGKVGVYGYALIVSRVLDGVLERRRPLIELTRIKRPRQGKTPQESEAEKQVLHQTFAFGRLLQDICDGTPLSVIWETHPPIHIPLQQGGEVIFAPSGTKARSNENRLSTDVRKTMQAARAYAADRSLNHAHRKNLLNFRILAEMLMFIGQTGMNLAQAQELQLKSFSYSSDIDGYKVRDYKHRRGGEVLFEIFSEYRPHFERYLAWRREIFPEEKRLFPLIRQDGVRSDRQISFLTVRTACEQAGVPWTPPRMLRGTRVNWLLRRSGDPDMTARMAQHSEQILLEVYQVPSLQRAISEVMRFHQKNDPTLAAVAPGECDGIPKVSPAKPETAPEPDCRLPSGCLWCEHHRDIESLEYIWALACFRHLKILELSLQRPAKKDDKVIHPAEHAIQRISEKLAWFRESNATRCEWVKEALDRVDEGYYHEQWTYLIKGMENPSA